MISKDKELLYLNQYKSPFIFNWLNEADKYLVSAENFITDIFKYINLEIKLFYLLIFTILALSHLQLKKYVQ